jgi:hypothetical protein
MATWVLNTIAATAYGGILVLMVVENVVPPSHPRSLCPSRGSW